MGAQVAPPSVVRKRWPPSTVTTAPMAPSAVIPATAALEGRELVDVLKGARSVLRSIEPLVVPNQQGPPGAHAAAVKVSPVTDIATRHVLPPSADSSIRLPIARYVSFGDAETTRGADKALDISLSASRRRPAAANCASSFSWTASLAAAVGCPRRGYSRRCRRRPLVGHVVEQRLGLPGVGLLRLYRGRGRRGCRNRDRCIRRFLPRGVAPLERRHLIGLLLFRRRRAGSRRRPAPGGPARRRSNGAPELRRRD